MPVVFSNVAGRMCPPPPESLSCCLFYLNFVREYAAFAHETISSLCPVRQNLDSTPESHPSLCAVRNNLELTHGGFASRFGALK